MSSTRGPKAGLNQFSPKRRARIKRRLIEKHGAVCWICREGIDLTLSAPDPRSWSTDHLKRISEGGFGNIDNLRPSHRGCNNARD